MSTIAEIFNMRVPTESKPSKSLVHTSKVGIEVELENVRCSGHPQGWRMIGDGSLRNNGVEFVFSGPAGGTTLVTRLKNLKKFLDDHAPEAEANDRCSVHVHLDARDMTVDQVKALICLYIAVEPFMYWVCGEHRADNIYCPSVMNAKEQLFAFMRLMAAKGNSSLVLMRGEFTKYSCLNIVCLRELGTLEFRGHEGTKDTRQILRWVNCILSLKKAVMDGISIPDIICAVSGDNAEAMVREVFGDLTEEMPSRVIESIQENSGYLLKAAMGDTNPTPITDGESDLYRGFIERYGPRWMPFTSLSRGRRYRISPQILPNSPDFSPEAAYGLIRCVLGVDVNSSVTSVSFLEERES